MSITLIEFQKTATSGQAQSLERILKLGMKEKEACEMYNAAHQPYWDAAERVRHSWGLHFRQVADLIISQEIMPEGDKAAAGPRNQLETVRSQLKDAFIDAVNDYGLARLGFIQRNYEHYVGKPIPAHYLQQSN